MRVIIKKYAEDEGEALVEEGLNALVKDLEKNCCKVVDIDVKSIRDENVFLIKYEPMMGYVKN